MVIRIGIKCIGYYYHTWTKLQNPSHDLQAPLDLTRHFSAPFLLSSPQPLLIRPFPRMGSSFPEIFHVFFPVVYSFWPCCTAWGVFAPRPGLNICPVVGLPGKQVPGFIFLISVHCCLTRVRIWPASNLIPLLFLHIWPCPLYWLITIWY